MARWITTVCSLRLSTYLAVEFIFQLSNYVKRNYADKQIDYPRIKNMWFTSNVFVGSVITRKTGTTHKQLRFRTKSENPVNSNIRAGTHFCFGVGRGLLNSVSLNQINRKLEIIAFILEWMTIRWLTECPLYEILGQGYDLFKPKICFL